MSEPAISTPPPPAFWPALLLAMTVIFAGVGLYYHNVDEFTFSQAQAGVAFAAGAAGLFTLLYLLALAFRRRRFYGRLITVFTALALACWLQANFLCTLFQELMLDDNTPPAQKFLAGLISLAVFLLPFLLLRRRRWLLQHLPRLTLALLLAQALPLAWRITRFRPSEYAFQEYNIQEHDKFAFGSDENVIVLVIDSMSDRVFKETLHLYPDIADIFQNFICFDNVVGAVPETLYAVPEILSGISFVGSKFAPDAEPHDRYMNRVCHVQESLLVQFKQMGWRVESYPFQLQTVAFDPELLDNLKTREVHTRSLHVFIDNWMLQMMPAFLAPLLKNTYLALTDRFITPGDSWAQMPHRVQHDALFQLRLQREARVGRAPRVFKYLHLHGAHKPYTVDERLERSPNSTVHQQLRGSLHVVETLIAKLRQLGLDEQTTLVVTGDHSEFYTPDTISFIRPAGQKLEKMRVNSVPASLADIAPTVLALQQKRHDSRSLLNKPLVVGKNRRDYPTMPEPMDHAWQEVTGAPASAFEEEWSIGLITATALVDSRRLVCEFVLHGEEIPVWQIAVKEMVSGRRWICPGLKPEPLHNKHMLVLSFSGLPDGLYVVDLDSQTTVIEYDLFDVESSRSVVHNLQRIDSFLDIRGNTLRLLAQYPCPRPQPLQIGKRLELHPLVPYPQLAYTQDGRIGGQGLRLREASQLILNLPVSPGKHQVVMEIQVYTGGNGRLEVQVNGKRRSRLRLQKNRSRYDLSVPVDCSQGGQAILTFTATSSTANREGGSMDMLSIKSIMLQ